MKDPLFWFARFLLVVIFFYSCNSQSKQTVQPPDVLASHIDSTVKPGDNFFFFANGKWFHENPIPPSEPSNGLWQIIQDTINAQILTICKSAAAMTKAPEGSIKQKIGDFFYSGMDSITRNKSGLHPLMPDLDRIGAVKDRRGIIEEAAYIHSVSGSPLFVINVAQDDRISSKYGIFIHQGGLSLPDRSFYFDKDLRAVKIRNAFQDHLYRMFRITGCGDADAQKAAEQVMKLEMDLAGISRKREDTRDPLKNYNKMPFEKLKQLSPDIDWKVFTEKVGLKNVDSVIVAQPEYITALSGFLRSNPTECWKNYLKYHLVRDLAWFLDDHTYKEIFSFYSVILNGVEEPKPRWKQVVKQTDNLLGELIGQVYVNEYLPDGTKEKLVEIGNAIKTVYAERIKTLDWMSDSTKQKALQKLNTLIMKVGYPDKWKDMSSLSVTRSPYVLNVMNANKWWFRYTLSKYGKPVDRTEWEMYPQTYNAYYNQSNNEIVIPGCNIIVPGYERKLADDAILYSIIGGSTFGHEITHGFDDQGCKYDQNGNLGSWWTKNDSNRFYTKTKLIVMQFNDFIAVDSLHVNGELTQGENIADLGGVMMGYEAFKKTTQYKNRQVIANLNPDQRFFLGYALAWMINERPETVASQVRSNEHSPAQFRVLGPLSNMQEFYTAFGIKQGEPMWRPDSIRVKIW